MLCLAKNAVTHCEGNCRVCFPLKGRASSVEELADSLREMGATFVLPFAFKNGKGNRTTHHLIFASKDFKGYEIMKEIMAKESSEVKPRRSDIRVFACIGEISDVV